LAESVPADQVVEEEDARRVRSAGRLADHAEASSRRARRHAVAGDGVVGQQHVVIAGDADSVPTVVVDGVGHEGVWAAIGVERGNAVAAIRVDQAVHHHGAWVASGGRDSTVALGRAVAKDPEYLADDDLVLVVAAQERNGRATRTRDRQSAKRDELRLLESDAVAVRARRDRAAKDDASVRRVWVRLDHDAGGFRRRRRAVL